MALGMEWSRAYLVLPGATLHLGGSLLEVLDPVTQVEMARLGSISLLGGLVSALVPVEEQLLG